MTLKDFLIDFVDVHDAFKLYVHMRYYGSYSSGYREMFGTNSRRYDRLLEATVLGVAADVDGVLMINVEE